MLKVMIMENVNDSNEKNQCDEDDDFDQSKDSFLCRTISFSFAGGDLNASTPKQNSIKETKPYKIIDLSKKCTSKCNKSLINTTFNDSSNGFQNTIAVLEKHVKQRKLWNTNDPNSIDDPTGLELQLMAIERLKSLSETTRLAWFLMNYIIFCDINNTTKREQKQANIQKLAENLKSDTNDCLYHIAREKSGLLYLKVVKSPQNDREEYAENMIDVKTENSTKICDE
uniref:CSON014983 protein n=1 Tax=Culicoides sonorensis TaxID=179676 RepID=A0A336MCE0_CULSO